MTGTAAVRAALRLAALCVASLLLAACDGSGHPTAKSTASQSHRNQVLKATVTTMRKTDAARLQAGLVSKKTAVAASALAPAVRPRFLKHGHDVLPRGSRVTIMTHKMLVSADRATVPAQVRGSTEDGIWLLFLQKVKGRWLIIGTQKQ